MTFRPMFVNAAEQQEHEDTDGSSSIDSDQALKDLLGGVGLSDLTDGAWDDQSDPSVDKSRTAKPLHKSSSAATTIPRTILEIAPTKSQNNIDESIFQNAYQCLPDGRLGRPDVCIVDTKDDRGNVLVATRNISKGSVIYTENKIAAVQTNGILNKKSGRVRACEQCFRSLEPASSCKLADDSTKSLPLNHLWPIRDPEEVSQVSDQGPRIIKCETCPTLFCSEWCKENFLASNGCTCCIHWKALQAASASYEKMIGSRNSQAIPDIGESDNTSGILPSSILLATRIFCILAYQSKFSGENENDELGLFRGICGETSDIHRLEIGVQSNPRVANEYTIHPVFEAVYNFLSADTEMSEWLSHDLFCRLCAMAARNGFEVSTKSPFSIYYSALTRESGGWGSDKHHALMSEVAAVLGSKDGIKRGMDSLVSKAVVPQIAAMYMLTARINHSCDPAAEVLGQQFVDSHIDLVAKRDIQRGEEITISYINIGKDVGKKSTQRRRNDLQARYLFWCQCPKCSVNISAVSNLK